MQRFRSNPRARVQGLRRAPRQFIAAAKATVEELESRLLFTITSTSLQIDSGGPAAGSFVADADFNGGSTYSTTASINTSAVASPAPQQVYQTERYGNNFSYLIPNLTSGDQYTVTLDFAENYYNAAGQRTFNVSINGASALNNFDIYATAGGKNKAIAESFTETADTNGDITIAFANITGGAKVDGIEISGPTAAAPTPTSTALQIDAGGPAAGSFVADADFSGGSTYSTSASIDTSAVTNPAPQTVYETERYGNNFNYVIPDLTPGDQYTLTLDFDETYYNGTGQRLFNVSINGVSALSDFDIYAAAGGKNKAIAETFTETADTSGNITIAFANITGGAKVDGIEISGPTTPTTPTTTGLQIDSGGPATGTFVADEDFSGGSTYSTTASIDTSACIVPPPQQVFQTERYGNNFSYAIPDLTPGDQYTVTLDFAELYYNGPAQRLFDVSINGASVLNNFDIYATAGGMDKAVAESFVETADANGKITIAFTNVTGGAKVDGIEIAPASTTTTPIASTPTITGLNLIDSDTNAAFEPLTDNLTIDLTNTLSNNPNGTNFTPADFNVVASTQGTVGSVVYTLDGKPSFDTDLANASLGAHTLTATPYSGAGGTGTAGAEITVHFTLEGIQIDFAGSPIPTDGDLAENLPQTDPSNPVIPQSDLASDPPVIYAFTFQNTGQNTINLDGALTFEYADDPSPPTNPASPPLTLPALYILPFGITGTTYATAVNGQSEPGDFPSNFAATGAGIYTLTQTTGPTNQQVIVVITASVDSSNGDYVFSESFQDPNNPGSSFPLNPGQTLQVQLFSNVAGNNKGSGSPSKTGKPAVNTKGKVA